MAFTETTLKRLKYLTPLALELTVILSLNILFFIDLWIQEWPLRFPYIFFVTHQKYRPLSYLSPAALPKAFLTPEASPFYPKILNQKKNLNFRKDLKSYRKNPGYHRKDSFSILTKHLSIRTYMIIRPNKVQFGAKGPLKGLKKKRYYSFPTLNFFGKFFFVKSKSIKSRAGLIG